MYGKRCLWPFSHALNLNAFECFVWPRESKGKVIFWGTDALTLCFQAALSNAVVDPRNVHQQPSSCAAWSSSVY